MTVLYVLKKRLPRILKKIDLYIISLIIMIINERTQILQEN